MGSPSPVERYQLLKGSESLNPPATSPTVWATAKRRLRNFLPRKELGNFVGPARLRLFELRRAIGYAGAAQAADIHCRFSAQNPAHEFSIVVVHEEVPVVEPLVRCVAAKAQAELILGPAFTGSS